MPALRHPSTGDPALQSKARRRLREDVRRDGIARGRGCERPDCQLPGVPIDYRPLTRGERPRPTSYVLDEIMPRDHGGDPADPTNVRPAHHRCNAAAGARMTNTKRRAKAATRSVLRLVLDDW